MPENDDANPHEGAPDVQAQPENVFQRARAGHVDDGHDLEGADADQDDADMFGGEEGEEQEDPVAVRMRQAETVPNEVLEDLGIDPDPVGGDQPLQGAAAFMADRIKADAPEYDDGGLYVGSIEPLYQRPEDICDGWILLGNLGPYIAGIMGQQQMGSRIGQVVQAMGRRIFSNFPCFHAMMTDAANDRRDGLGEIQVVVDRNMGNDLDDPTTAARVSGWLEEHGEETVELAQLDFDAIFPGYRPQVVFTATADRSFVTVRETRERGAPVNATYFYTWPGGMMHYHANPADLGQVRALAAAIRHQLPQPRPPAPAV